jgi:Skp family chaperone for outer membrane proteins
MRALPLALFLFAAPLAAEAQVKTAVVDVQKVMNATTHWKSAVADLEKDRKLKQASLESKQKELKDRKEKLDAKKAVSDPNATIKDEELLFKDAQELTQAFLMQQQELTGWEKRITEAMLERIELVVREVALTGDYEYVFEVGPEQTPNVLYSRKDIDITQKVIDTYAKRYKDKGLDIKRPGSK